MKLFKYLFLLFPLLVTSCGNSSSSVLTSSSFSSSSSSEVPIEPETSELYERIWMSKTIHNEACVLLENTNGTISTNLVYTPTKIISVKDYSEKVTYTEQDYFIEGNTIYLTKDSSIPYLTRNNINCYDIPSGVSTYDSYKVRSGKILFTESSELVKYQLHVTYEHSDNWEGNIPTKQGDKLTKLQDKLKNHEDINMVIYGDSISVGCNASSRLGIDPYLDTFDVGFAKEIERLYGSKVNITNTSQGSTTSTWGKDNVQEKVINHNPDLVFIGFGMNDGGKSSGISTKIYHHNIDEIVTSILNALPNTEIILCSTILANKDSTQDYIQSDFLNELETISSSYESVVLMDMTSLSSTLRDKKNSFELYANNINHPTDFVVRQYVAMLLETIKKISK